MFTRPQGIALKKLSHKACEAALASRLAGPASRSITKAVTQIGSKLPRSPKTAALGVSTVACAAASLVSIASGARLSLPGCRSLAGSPNAGAWAEGGKGSQSLPPPDSKELRTIQDRAPPIQVAAVR